MTSDLNDIFEIDPLELTIDDPRLEKLIAGMREQRVRFNQGDIRAGTNKPKPPKGLTKELDELDGLKLELD